jgi:hypothetical protein
MFDFSNTKTSKEDKALILKIAQRRVRIAKENGFHDDVVSACMDIEAAHSQMPLRLRDLLEASQRNFVHDAFGIMANLNRRTGKMENRFVPRFTATEEQTLPRYALSRLMALIA